MERAIRLRHDRSLRCFAQRARDALLAAALRWAFGVFFQRDVAATLMARCISAAVIAFARALPP